jgi:hypothetical protein
MTHLDLSGRQSSNTQPSPAAETSHGIRNQTLGGLGALAVFAAVIIIGSCSQKSKPAVVQSTQPAPVTLPAAGTTTAPAPPPALAKTGKRRASTLSYRNRDYGISFRFPREYQLRISDAGLANLAAAWAVSTNFVHPGGTTLAAVVLPDNSYPGSNFEAALINVSVSPGMTSRECSQFAFPGTGSGTTPTVVKAGANQFTEVEQLASANHQADARYYHIFRNATCYEFAMAVATGRDKTETGIAKGDRGEVFGKLEKILATVKLPSPAAVSQGQAASSAVWSNGGVQSESHPDF